MRFPLLPRVAACFLFFFTAAVIRAVPVEISAPEIRDPQQPQIAANARGTIFVAFGSGSEIYLVSSHDGGKTFGAPVKVGRFEKLALGMRRGPRVATVGETVTVTAENGADLLAFHSEDEGRTWSAPATINTSATSGREGLHNLASSPQGQLYATWLDLRSGQMEIYGALSADGGKTWQHDELVYHSPDGHVCECCHPSAAFNTKGDLVVMWRNWLGGSRDLWTAVRPAGKGHFEPATKQGEGTWKLAGCPMDGGSVFALNDGSFASAFRRDKEVFLTLKSGTERRIGEGTQPVALNDRGTLHVLWQQGADLMHTTTADSAAPAMFAADAKFGSAAVSPQDGSVVVAFERSVGQRKAIFADVLR
jgi:hypothetical protein